jgi:hypothetical protein
VADKTCVEPTVPDRLNWMFAIASDEAQPLDARIPKLLAGRRRASDEPTTKPRMRFFL